MKFKSGLILTWGEDTAALETLQGECGMKSFVFPGITMLLMSVSLAFAVPQNEYPHSVFLRWDSGTTRQYPLIWDSGTGTWSVQNTYIEIDLELNSGIYTATVKNLKSGDDLIEFRHPQDQAYDFDAYYPDPNVYRQPIEDFEYDAGNDPNNDVILSAGLWMGYALDNATLQSTNIDYPGAFAPVVIQADFVEDVARITAAVNWPPKELRLTFSKGRQSISALDLDPNDPNKVVLEPNETYSMSYIRTEVTGSGTTPAWKVAADKYKTWLRQYVSRDPNAVVTVSEEQWISDIHGMINYQLEARPVASLNQIPDIWNNYKHKLPWIQFWGQMPDDPATFNPITGDPIVDCCALFQQLNERFDPNDPNIMEWDLLGFVSDILDPNDPNDYHAGYYIRPYPGYSLVPDELITEETLSNRTWISNWVDKALNDWGANAIYNDTLAAKNWGAPLEVANYLNTSSDFNDTVAEGAQDVYPLPFFVSGALRYGLDPLIYHGGEDTDISDLLSDPNMDAVSFAELGAYILSDRVIFNGQSNGGHLVWRSDQNYWGERETFLLGWKYEVQHPFDNWNNIPVWDPALKCAIDLRDSVNWWSAKPEYDDVSTIVSVPAGVDIRHHVTDTLDYYVIDNWDCAVDLTNFLSNKAEVEHSTGNKMIFVGPAKLTIVTLDSSGNASYHTASDCLCP